MNVWAQLGVALFLAVIVYSVAKKIVQNKMEDRYLDWFAQGEYEKIEGSIRSFQGKWLFPLYNREHLLLQVAQVQNNKEEIDKLFEEMLSQKLTPTQRQETVMAAFEYYVFEQDRLKAKPLYGEIRQNFDKKIAHRAKLMYEVFLNHKADHIDELLELLESVPDSEKGTCCLLLAQSYKNKHDEQEQLKYEQLAKQYF
ncbi:hypothetical protein C815_00636 [Firmicutes bacterium M10-2]|nr:hypothetical protein C815_00636 [Firmicutes bacterium M10-2]